MKNLNLSWLLGFYIVLAGCYALFSYSLTDPNLVLFNRWPYWDFQLWMWDTFFENRQLLTATFVLIITSLLVVYGLIVGNTRSNHAQNLVEREHWVWFGLLVAVLGFSYNALSHDVFNYIFNARMVDYYQQNPHVHTALEFQDDLWTRFMHNTHTAAPYGYGWTALSLIPYYLGAGKFLSTWLAFRVLAIGGVILLYIVLQKLSVALRGRNLYFSEAAVLFLNPMFLLEIISTMHNDIWMMVPALASVLVALQFDVAKTSVWKAGILSLALLVLSASVKYATVVLLPVIVFIFSARLAISRIMRQKLSRLPFNHQLSSWIAKYFESWWRPHVAFVCSVLLFLPLFTSRSQLFHPWYLVWSLSWLPLLRDGWWKLTLIAFSVSSLLRYVPWMWNGGFEGRTFLWQQVITWSIPLLVLAFKYFLGRARKSSFSLYNG